MSCSPLVSIIIPCYRERLFIGGCLDSLLSNTYPKDRMEVLVMDGGSDDGTRGIVKDYCERYSFVRLLDNPRKFRPFALNRGIEESKGSIIIACDAHATYCKDYVEKLVFWLRSDASIGNVGGLWLNVPSSGTLKARAITYSLSCPFCVGPNRYRTGIKKPASVDTVPFGAWRRDLFDKVGLFNEEFLRAADLELNMRLKLAGYMILLDPEIKIYYYPRENFLKLLRMMCQYGYWKNFVNKKLQIVSSARQFAPPVFVLYLLSTVFLAFLSPLFFIPLAVYLVITLICSAAISAGKKEIKILPYCAFSFIVSHIGYGAGYIKGFWDVFIRKDNSPAKDKASVTR